MYAESWLVHIVQITFHPHYSEDREDLIVLFCSRRHSHLCCKTLLKPVLTGTCPGFFFYFFVDILIVRIRKQNGKTTLGFKNYTVKRPRDMLIISPKSNIEPKIIKNCIN